jgi:hypothetical protein
MALFAQFDPGAPQPAPVTGWYDTSALEYPSLPSNANLIEVTSEQWSAHFSNPNGWAVSDGELVASKTTVAIQE